MLIQPSYHIWPYASQSISPQSTVPDKPCIHQTVNPALPTHSKFIIHADMRFASILMPQWQETAYLQCMPNMAWMQRRNFCRNLFANVSVWVPAEVFLLSSAESRSFSPALAWIRECLLKAPLVVCKALPLSMSMTHTHACRHTHTYT